MVAVIQEASDGVGGHGIEGLFDIELVLAPDGGLALPGQQGTSLTARELVDLIELGGGAGLDVRLVAPAGEEHLPTLFAVARHLDRDVLVAPPGAQVQPVSVRTADGRRQDVVAIDDATGRPVDWWTVSPAGQVGVVPGWFDLSGGMVRRRTGTVALPLPGGGVMLPTRADFVAARAAAALLRPGHPGLVTVVVGVRSGRFVLGDYGGGEALGDGSQLAAALSGLPLYGADLRLWLSWPAGAADRGELSRSLAELADVTGATAWVPEEGTRVELRPGCRDLAAVGLDGEPASWRPYGLVNGTFESDVDGRLVPVGGVALDRPTSAGRPRPAAVDHELATRTVPSVDAFTVELAVLGDGRLALRYNDGTLLAAGGRQLGQLLRAAGWRGGPVAVVSNVAAERAAGAGQHSAELAAELGVAVTLVSPAGTGTGGTDRSLAAGRRRLPGPDVTAGADRSGERVDVSASSALDDRPDTRPEAVRDLASAGGASSGGPAEGSPPPGLAYPYARVTQRATAGPGSNAGPPAPIDAADGAPHSPPAAHRAPSAPRERQRPVAGPTRMAEWIERPPDPDAGVDAPAAFNAPAMVDAPAAFTAAAVVDAPSLVDGPAVVEAPVGSTRGRAAAWTRSSRIIDGPRVAPADHGTPPHRLAWLPPAPQVNVEPFELYVECPVDVADALTGGVPSPYLFLLGHLDRDRLAARTSAHRLLQVRVEPAGAVDVSASEVPVPRALVTALSENDVYLLPAAWLDRCRVTATVAVSPGEPPGPEPGADQRILVRCLNAGHGVAGLPVESVRWPQRGLRSWATRFALVPETAIGGLGTWLSLLARRPRPTVGHRLLELAVPRGVALNVVATAAALAPLTSVRHTAAELMADGVQVLLPVASFARTTVIHESRADARGWRRVPGRRRIHLDAWAAGPANDA